MIEIVMHLQRESFVTFRGYPTCHSIGSMYVGIVCTFAHVIKVL